MKIFQLYYKFILVHASLQQTLAEFLYYKSFENLRQVLMLPNSFFHNAKRGENAEAHMAWIQQAELSTTQLNWRVKRKVNMEMQLNNLMFLASAQELTEHLQDNIFL